MSLHVRRATATDVAAVVALLLEDAAERKTLDPRLWPLAANAADCVQQRFAKEVNGESQIRWLVAESSGALVGVVRAGVVPVPPIYQFAGQVASLLFEETYAAKSAPLDVYSALIAMAEKETGTMNAISYLAACAPSQERKLRAFEAAGYRIVTHYLVKHNLSDHQLIDSVRPASPQDVPGIVALGARSQQSLCGANARMWTPHPEAPTRFGAWMQYSLTLPDRRIFVSGADPLDGFVIAQPPSQFHLPLTAPNDHLGLIDDFWSTEFDAAQTPNQASAKDLLATAEHEFRVRGRTSAMVITAAAPQPKQDFLRTSGYRDANAWMLKG
jgi:hypothetical protein